MPTKHAALIALAAAVGVAGCATTSQQVASNSVSGTRCEALSNNEQRVQELLNGSVTHVAPAYHHVPHFEGSKALYVAGAEIYLAADTEMNEAYLERALSCFAASSAGQDSPLGVAGIRSISATPAGQTFRIEILGADRQTGEQIWKRAQAIGSTRVEVRQLSAAPSNSSTL